MPSQDSDSQKKKDKSKVGSIAITVAIGAGLGYFASKIFSPDEIEKMGNRVTDGVKKKVGDVIDKLFP